MSSPGASASRLAGGLRRQAFGACVALILEYLLGMAVNLYATIPAGDRGAGLGAAIGRAVAHGPAALASHAVLGLLLIAAALAVTARSIAARFRGVAIMAILALLCVIGAAVSGASFVGSEKAGASLTMAALTGAALLLYLAIIYVLPRRDGARPDTPATAALVPSAHGK